MSRAKPAISKPNQPVQLELSAFLLHNMQSAVVGRVELPSRRRSSSALPPEFQVNKASAEHVRSFSPDGKVWLHQAKALGHIANGHDVLVTTGTGSGKTLVFQLPILRELTTGEGSALVFYPQKALCSDQLLRWRTLLTSAGLPETLVGEINGDTPMHEREEIIAGSRIVLATPDVTHAWLLRLQSAPKITEFLSRLRFIVLDEAHTLDGVFGSNCAYLFRRLELAIERARGDKPNKLQFIAASATIRDAAAHLAQLTGRSFEVVDEEWNGAPGQEMTVLHIEGPERGTAAETLLTETLGSLVNQIGEDAMVAFADGRQAVERITKKLGDDRVLPYRSGYELSDRREIETALASGSLRACVATSALELGIDVAGFRIGFNLGIPATRKSLRQRIGRVGRAKSGVFAIIAPRNAFARLGTTLEEFVSGTVEPSQLYLQNTAIQYQQACCLAQETSGAGMADVRWPAGFAAMCHNLATRARLPRELERLANSASDSPHHSFPLRQIADTRMVVRLSSDQSTSIGTITLEKALREAYPGATYLHYRKAYRVVDWRVASYERSILVEPVMGGPPSLPMLSAKAEIAQDDASLLSDHILKSDRGSMVERCLRITETVHGFAIGTKQFPYSALSQNDRRLRSKYRQFESTGVVLRITEPWFAGGSARKVETRKRVATALRTILLAERGILPSEVGQSHSGIALISSQNRMQVDDAIVIFDDIQGGLRLTAPIFANFSDLLKRLRKAAELAGEDPLLDVPTITRLEEWHASLEIQSPPASGDLPTRIFAPGSELCGFRNGEVTHYKVTGHQIMSIEGSDLLMYSYETSVGGSAWVSHEQLQPSSDNWRYLSGDKQFEEVSQ